MRYLLFILFSLYSTTALCSDGVIAPPNVNVPAGGLIESGAKSWQDLIGKTASCSYQSCTGSAASPDCGTMSVSAYVSNDAIPYVQISYTNIGGYSYTYDYRAFTDVGGLVYTTYLTGGATLAAVTLSQSYPYGTQYVSGDENCQGEWK